MRKPSKRFIPNSWTEKMIPVLLVLLLLVLLAVLVITGMAMLGVSFGS